MRYLLLLLVLVNVGQLNCLYEDQVGKFDWRHQFVGRVDRILRTTETWQEHSSLIVSTQSNVISGLHLRNGSIHWRHILEEAGPVNQLSNGFKTSGFNCPLLSVNSYGRFVRCWSLSGVLLLEHNLPADFVSQIESDSSNQHLLFEADLNDQKEPCLNVMRISHSSYLLEYYQYNFKQQKLSLISKWTAGKWLDTTDCKLITSKQLICIEQSQQDFQLLTLKPGSQFYRIPFSSFGLKSETKPKYLTLHLLPLASTDKTVTISKSANTKLIHFAVDLGGEGFALFQFAPPSTSTPNPNIYLGKILPNAVRLTIIPLISANSDSPNVEDYGLAVLFAKPNAIPFEDEKDGEDGEKVFALKLVIFHLSTWDQIESMSTEQILLQFGSKHSISPIVSSGKLVKRLDNQWKIDLFEVIPIRTTILNSRTGRNQYRHTYKMVISTVDGTLIVMNLMGKVTWAREEALAEIASLVMLDLPLSETDAITEQEYGFDNDGKNIVSMFVKRIHSQWLQLTVAVRSLQNWLLSLSGKVAMRSASKARKMEEKYEQELNPNNPLESESSSVEEDEEEEIFVRDYFGLHKVIMVRTKVGKLFAIDSLSGRIIWSRYDPRLYLKSQTAKFPIWVQRTSAHYPHSAVCTFLAESSSESRSIIYSFDPFNGQVLDTKVMPSKAIQAMMLQSIHDSDFIRPLLILDSNLDASLYPDTPAVRSLFSKVANHHYMMLVNQSSAELVGFSFAKSDSNLGASAQPVWNFRLPQEYSKITNIYSVFKRPHEHVHSQGRVLGDRNVLYKYLNPNLVAIICESLDTMEKPLITLYLVDSITGNIVHSVVHKRAQKPIQLVHSENWVIYSYYNDKMRRNEVSSIELFEGFDQINATAFSSIGRDLMSVPLVEQKTFIFPTGIGIMTDTETQKGITNKHILISLPTGGLLDLPRAFLDPRRPIKPTQEHAEEGLIPYVPELPIPSEAMINYNQTIMAVKGIETSPTALESTSLVFAYGLDIFYTRVTPSKTFDILKDDFDHWLILAVLVTLIAFSYLAKMLSARKSLNAAWK